MGKAINLMYITIKPLWLLWGDWTGRGKLGVQRGGRGSSMRVRGWWLDQGDFGGDGGMQDAS